MADLSTFIIIAVDGGAASGKSSTSTRLAKDRNYLHVDTGSHYRAITLSLLNQGISGEAIAEIEAALPTLKLGTAIKGTEAFIEIEGAIPPNETLRSEAINQSVSPIAAIPAVRQFLLQYQRSQADLAREKGFAGLIMEGRDIGSIIFPNADYRLFFEADAATRAARRAKEGHTDSIEKRDKIDSSRKTAPLVCPEGATRIDTSNHSLEEVVAQVAQIIGH